MKKKAGIAIIIVISTAIILWGFVLVSQDAKNAGNNEHSYVQEQNSVSPEDTHLNESTDAPREEKEENYSIEKGEDDGEHKGTEQVNISDEELETEELSEEEQIRAWYEEWFNMDNPLWDSNTKEFRQKSLAYQLAEPCHFVLLPACAYAYEIYNYRNIDDSSLYNEYGERVYLREAYMADVIVDKYIREYGGKESLYSIKDTSKDLGDLWETGLFEVYTFEINNEDTKLRVLWTLYDPLVSVYIESTELEEIDEFEKITYIYESSMHDWRAKYDEYWLLIDTEFQQKEYCYRNVEPNLETADDNELKCDERAYYIADQAIDKYIRDYGGNDSLYNMELTEKEEDAENGEYVYVLSVENLEDPEQRIQIEYSDASWLVSVKVPDGKERMLKYHLGQ